MPVVWDTGSEWPVVVGYTCNTIECIGMTKYDYSAEEGITFYPQPNTEGERNYGSAQTSGFEAKDWLCLVSGTPGSCVTDMEIFIITE